MDQQDKTVSDKELLTNQYDYWRNELFSRVASIKQAELEKQRDPNKMLTTQDGRKVTISQIVESRKAMVREALQHVEAFEELLQACEAGTLATYWSEDALREGVVLHGGQSFPVQKGGDTGSLIPKR